MTPKTFAIALIDMLLCAIFPLRAIRKRSLQNIAPRRILISRPDHIGDLYLSIPCILAIREHYPNAHLTVLVASWAAPLLEEQKIGDELLVCDPPWWSQARQSRFGVSSQRGSWKALWKTIGELRRRKFDLCIELRGDVRQILAFGVLSGAKNILTRSRNGGARLADCAPFIDETQHECGQNMQLIQSLGISAAQPVFPPPYSPQDAESGKRIMEEKAPKSSRIKLVIHPGAKWVNRWPSERYAQLITSLCLSGPSRSQINIFLTGAASEASLCEELAKASPEITHVLAGQLSLRQTAAVMAMADLVVMADTGPMHFLNALETKALLLFGPTSSARFAPRTPNIHILSANSCCNAALHEICTRVSAGCPSACMEEISVTSVRLEIDRLLKAKRPSSLIQALPLEQQRGSVRPTTVTGAESP